ncbi:MAG: hypothetical protein CGU28_08930 [Candidatus Dactylopiibacterium carminicum]|uniref:Uncharacterized protein n=1 Tax=Candidatus Dactylopiibacterium carminicum TaxID=857335 RepID=A0A272EWC9_9RHOO|nr:hypothetical protein [Candidatus Dactylopiibacterium carminicum]KAF7599571.1 hypothetical protein BGI27_07325 [Candidatus Dactylopiibacterium carminicum]PAS94413.1 MAG: hypothetical protein CGU29_03630 [Candidatus Dactylopiibacterium carminicum]PAS96424.1 MAG: hypothetical protein CGU28_08930 [Candidatus Dactylopiibacterium carminicum]PAS99574.1 MAG: hypothetical protein BSR46_07360 [Candidatus Dactylopiibacterium carminicum]
MMLVWIVWSTQPLAVFSSEQRARAFIAHHGAEQVWSCCAARLNPEALTEAMVSVPQESQTDCLEARH